ncbi:hypothetical protein GYB29_06085 [bacterium]|nr:hypothetical protein [Balneola sp.]MBR9917246.1 hypothetical protein [bacterium]
MKQIIFITGIYILFLGCAELGTALSQVNEDMGAQCALYLASTDAYHEGEYHEDTSFEIDDAWADSQADYYASLRRFDIYFGTSPEGNKYRFRVYCGRYH